MKGRTVAHDITDAMFEMLKSKELASITVTELISSAGVCRASFYRHFYLLEDVIRQYGSALYEEIDRTIPLVPGGIYEHLLAVTTYLWGQRERLALIEQRNLHHLLVEPIKRQCVIQLQRLNAWTSHYQVEFYAGAVNQVIRAWARSNFAESPEEITGIIHSLVHHEPMQQCAPPGAAAVRDESGI